MSTSTAERGFVLLAAARFAGQPEQLGAFHDWMSANLPAERVPPAYRLPELLAEASVHVIPAGLRRDAIG